MEQNRQEQMTEVLRRLQTETPYVEGAAVLDLDGLVIASSLPSHDLEERISAMSAVLFGAGERTAQELVRGTVEQVHLKCSDGSMLVIRAGPNAVLSVTVSSKAKLGIVLLDIRQAAQELAELI